MVGKYLKIRTVILTLICMALQSHASNVLLINSYHNGDFWTDMLTEGIKNELKIGPNINLYIEYLDTKRNPDYCFSPKFLNHMELQYENIDFKLLILTDNDALDFYLMNQNHQLFRNKPVIATGISDVENYPELPNLFFFTVVR